MKSLFTGYLRYSASKTSFTFTTRACSDFDLFGFQHQHSTSNDPSLWQPLPQLCRAESL